MQQAIYTNIHGNSHAFSGHGTDAVFDVHENGTQANSTQKNGTQANKLRVVEPQDKQFENLRLVFSVLGNVLGGALLLSGMLMLPQLLVSLLGT